MEPLCFQGHYRRRFARVKEFSNEKIEVVLDDFLRQFCNCWLEEEFIIQSGAASYERTGLRQDYRAGHYERFLATSRGVLRLRVPRGSRNHYAFSLFERFKRKTKDFESIVLEALLKGHSSRKASEFFAKLFGSGTISHQAACSTLKAFDLNIGGWKSRPVQDKALILVLDAVWLKGAQLGFKSARPVLFAYAVYEDGHEEVLDFEFAKGESWEAWYRFCQRLELRGLKSARFVVADDAPAIAQAVSFVWPKATFQACVFHLMQNVAKRLKGLKDKRRILKDIAWLYEAQSRIEFEAWAKKFKARWIAYERHPAFRHFWAHIDQTIQYFVLPKKFWRIAKTSNRLERLFEELRRRIRVFRRFQNAASCQRWLYALLTQLNKVNNKTLLLESQQSS
jgi:putative transposase